jgi:hypothetical protein
MIVNVERQLYTDINNLVVLSPNSNLNDESKFNNADEKNRFANPMNNDVGIYE